MSEKYIRVEDLDGCTICRREPTPLGTHCVEFHPGTLPTYTPAEIMAGQWVPVAEMLPEPLVEVLALYGNGGINIDWLDYDGNFIFADLFDGVTHWMPLPPMPQPPKEAT